MLKNFYFVAYLSERTINFSEDNSDDHVRNLLKRQRLRPEANPVRSKSLITSVSAGKGRDVISLL